MTPNKPPAVKELFQPSSKPSVIIPTQPFLSSHGITLIDGQRNSLATLEVKLAVGGAEVLAQCAALLVIAMLASITMVLVV
jgi:hypothetical protein